MGKKPNKTQTETYHDSDADYLIIEIISMTSLEAHQTAIAMELALQNYANKRYCGDHNSQAGLNNIQLS